jgi:hypothetical protein
MAILRLWLRPALALGFFLTALAYAQALAAPFPFPARADPTALQFSGWPALAAAAAASAPAFLTSDDYATAATLAFDAPSNIPVAAFWPRWSSFAWPQAVAPGAIGLLVTRRTDTACPVQLGTFTRRRGNDPVATYKLCRFVAPNAGVLLPRP